MPIGIAGRIVDGDLRAPTDQEVDATFEKARLRNPHLEIPPDKSNYFSVEAVHLAFGDSLTSLSYSRDYHLWNFGSWDTKPTTPDLVKMITYLKAEADTKWGRKPIRAFINGRCPFVKEFERDGKLIQELFNALEQVQPGSVVLYPRPINLEIPIYKDGVQIGVKSITEVYAHSLPMDRIDVD